MKCLVTGVAGFIGSSISERLIQEGHSVRGIDCFTDYYPRVIKESNLNNLLILPEFEFYEENLIDGDIATLMTDIDVVYHEAAQAGVRASWGTSFSTYTENNIFATQRLLEYARTFPIKKFIYASSSSVYGDVPGDEPMSETLRPQPVSPYGVSKLAAEHLCYLYWKNFKVPTVSLRYFTVYGPRQRPDMGFHKFIRAILDDKPITIFGDGTQRRDFTYIDDLVDANLSAMTSGVPGEVYNIGGGHVEELNQVLALLAELAGKKANLQYIEKQKGDVDRTSADITKAKRDLKYQPKYDVRRGLKNEIDWIRLLIKE
jgi:nucleoside-diphosphate-sugar epimerase